MGDRAIYENDVVPIFEAVEQLLTAADIPYAFVVLLDDETLEYRHSFPPQGVKSLHITIPKDGPAKVVPVSESPGPVVDAAHYRSRKGEMFDGRAVDFTSRESSENGK